MAHVSDKSNEADRGLCENLQQCAVRLLFLKGPSVSVCVSLSVVVLAFWVALHAKLCALGPMCCGCDGSTEAGIRVIGVFTANLSRVCPDNHHVV